MILSYETQLPFQVNVKVWIDRLVEATEKESVMSGWLFAEIEGKQKGHPVTMFYMRIIFMNSCWKFKKRHSRSLKNWTW